MSGGSAAGSAVADVLSGKYGNDRFLAGGIWRRWDRDGGGGGDAAGWIWICVPAGSAGGDSIRDGGDYGRDGNWGLRQFAEEPDGPGHAAGDLFYFADDDAQWKRADAAGLFDVGGEAKIGLLSRLRRADLFGSAGDVLLRGGYVEKMGLEWVAADEEAWVAKFLAFAIVGDIVECVVENVVGCGKSILRPADAALRSVAA